MKNFLLSLLCFLILGFIGVSAVFIMHYFNADFPGCGVIVGLLLGFSLVEILNYIYD